MTATQTLSALSLYETENIVKAMELGELVQTLQQQSDETVDDGQDSDKYNLSSVSCSSSITCKSKSNSSNSNLNRDSSSNTNLHSSTSLNANVAFHGFEKFLHDKKKRKSFAEFLKGEHNEENLLFWIDVQRFQKDFKKVGRDESIAKAAEITATYLIPRSRHEVNVSYTMRKAIIQDLLYYIKLWDTDEEAFALLTKQLSMVRLDSKSTNPLEPLDYSNAKTFQDIFYVTVTHITEMMFKDIYPRYIKSLNDAAAGALSSYYNNNSNSNLSTFLLKSIID